MELSRAERIRVRDLWKDEAREFTPWLEDNIDLLSECLGMKLEVLPKEKRKLNGYEVDILARDKETDELVVVENQFGKSDHDHLGKLLTYMRLSKARVGVWVCDEPRLEHIEMVSWLNENLRGLALYLVKLDVFRIDESPPAPLFTVLTGPRKEVEEEIPERHRLRLEFWERLLRKSNEKTDLFGRRSPTTESWLSASAGKTGFAYVYVVLMDGARVELWIDTGEKEKNKKYFDELFRKKEEIEKAFGEELEWQRLNESRGCRICKIIAGGGLRQKSSWEDLQNKMVDAMVRLQKAFSEHIETLG
jgi:hypothetical protein